MIGKVAPLALAITATAFIDTPEVHFRLPCDSAER